MLNTAALEKKSKHVISVRVNSACQDCIPSEQAFDRPRARDLLFVGGGGGGGS